MAVYKTRWFDRWARKEGLTTPSLCAAVREMAAGLYDADLGGGLLKRGLRDLDRGSVAALHAGRHQQGNPLGVRVRLPEERAQQHRQG